MKDLFRHSRSELVVLGLHARGSIGYQLLMGIAFKRLRTFFFGRCRDQRGSCNRVKTHYTQGDVAKQTQFSPQVLNAIFATVGTKKKRHQIQMQHSQPHALSRRQEHALMRVQTSRLMERNDSEYAGAYRNTGSFYDYCDSSLTSLLYKTTIHYAAVYGTTSRNLMFATGIREQLSFVTKHFYWYHFCFRTLTTKFSVSEHLSRKAVQGHSNKQLGRHRWRHLVSY